MSQTFFFSVDSALLRELGERLVGQHHIALAELVKNAYDADATRCEIEVTEDTIIVRDDGHGMTPDEFQHYWLRIGTTHKARELTSKSKRRVVTGSKGIGRLAVQFLARKLVLFTRSDGSRAQGMSAEVDWRKAIAAGDLTKAPVEVDSRVDEQTFAGGSKHGVEIRLTGLRHKWTDADFKSLAQEIWTLRPPFRESVPESSFDISLSATDVSLVRTFDEQLAKVTEAWGARVLISVEGGLANPQAAVTVQILANFIKEGRRSINPRDRTFRKKRLRLPVVNRENEVAGQGNLLDSVSADIRIYRLDGKQRGGISLQDLRTYLDAFGGVGIYDEGFRLPYYGVKQDWLSLDRDSARRISASALLPDELQIPLMMHDLPSQRRMLGVVSISTNREATAFRRSHIGDESPLVINPGRDRLTDNNASRQLRDLVRWGLDYYVSCYNRAQFDARERVRPNEPSGHKQQLVNSALERHRPDIPPEAYAEISREFRDFSDTVQQERSYERGLASLLGPLATAGMSALALDHEIARVLPQLRMIATGLMRDPQTQASGSAVEHLCEQIEESREIFSALTNAADREESTNLLARSVIQGVVDATKPFHNRAAIFSKKVPEGLYLPPAPLAAWNAIFQNLLFNSLNATLDADRRRISFDGGGDDSTGWVRVSDTGVGLGMDIDRANEKLFQPFVRLLELTHERKSLGIGGYGLGLTIVRTMARELGCEVAFTQPRNEFRTSLTISWSLQ